MLSEENIKFVTFEAEIEEESDWQKIDKAIDNIKIGDIKADFSLPIEFTEIIDKVPRRILRSTKHGYSMFVSPKKISFRFDLRTHTLEVPPEKEEKESRTFTEILREGESTFNLFIGAFLGARPKVIETMKVKWRIRFEFPLKEHLVQYVKTPFLEELKKHNAEASFALEEILISQNLRDERTTYEILEDPEEKTTEVEIVRNFKSPVTTTDLVKLAQDSIKAGNEFLSLMGKEHGHL
jgi:hypothetical protein